MTTSIIDYAPDYKSEKHRSAKRIARVTDAMIERARLRDAVVEAAKTWRGDVLDGTGRQQFVGSLDALIEFEATQEKSL